MRYTLPERADGKPHLAFLLKTCPRCVGDLVLHRDVGGDYYTCLQCGVEIEPHPEAAQPSPAGRTEVLALPQLLVTDTIASKEGG